MSGPAASVCCFDARDTCKVLVGKGVSVVSGPAASCSRLQVAACLAAWATPAAEAPPPQPPPDMAIPPNMAIPASETVAPSRPSGQQKRPPCKPARFAAALHDQVRLRFSLRSVWMNIHLAGPHERHVPRSSERDTSQPSSMPSIAENFPCVSSQHTTSPARYLAASA